MTLELSEPTLMADFAKHLRAAGFLVLVGEDGRLEAHLLNAVSDRYDRARLREAVDRWRGQHAAVTVAEVG